MIGERISKNKPKKMRTGICKRCDKRFNFQGVRFKYCNLCTKKRGLIYSQPEKTSSKEDLIAN